MENKNEENKNISKESLGKDQEISQNVMGENNIPIQRQAFQVDLPDGRKVNTETRSFQIKTKRITKYDSARWKTKLKQSRH